MTDDGSRPMEPLARRLGYVPDGEGFWLIWRKVG
jgi:hypothetical protein